MSIFSATRSISISSVFSELEEPKFSLSGQKEGDVEDEDIEEEEEEVGEIEFEPLPPEYWFSEQFEDEDKKCLQNIMDLDLSKEFKLGKSFHNLNETDIYFSICKELRITPIGDYEGKCFANNFDASLRALESQGLLALCRALEKNTCVTELNLSKNCIDGEAVNYLVELLRRNYFISNLDLSCNRLGDRGAHPITQMIKTATYLTHLNLSSNNLTVEHMRVIAKGIEESKALQELNLSRNVLSNTGAAIVGRMMANNVTIIKLDLSWNEIFGRGATLVMAALKQNYTLEVLKLAHNGFKDENSPAISNGLANNESLRELDLTSNRITGNGAKRIARGLGRNDCLEILKLAKNPIDAKSALHLLSKSKMKLKELDLSGVLISKEFLVMARSAIKERDYEFIVKYGWPIKGMRNTKSSSLGERRSDNHPLEVIRIALLEKHVDIKDILFHEEGPIEKQKFIELFRKAECGILENDVASLYDTLEQEEQVVNVDVLLNELDEADGDIQL